MLVANVCIFCQDGPDEERSGHAGSDQVSWQ